MHNLLHDEPTLTDLLQRAALVKKIGDTVATCQPPTVLGVHGDWGSGKTSFLHQLQFYLSGACQSNAEKTIPTPNPAVWPSWSLNQHDHCAVIWFEAWRYQHEPAPIVALLHEIRAQLPAASKLFNTGKKLADVAVKSALFSLDSVTKWIGIQASKVQEQGEQWEKEHLAEQLPSHTLREFLEQAIKQLLPRPQRSRAAPRVVVLIDDLDRCESQTAYRLLEGIKIYLNLPNCVFVLGVNHGSIEASLAEQLAKEKAEQPTVAAKLRAREYLDKICRNFWQLPEYDRVDLLVNNWLGTAIQTTQMTVQPNIGFYGRYLWYYRCLPNIPRRIKGYINTLARFLIHLHMRQITVTDQHGWMCLILSYLYHFHPDIYQRIEWYPDFYNTLQKWCNQDDANALKHELLEGLRRIDNSMITQSPSAPNTVSSGTAPFVPPNAATPITLANPTYPDLHRANVFHIQLLMRAFQQQSLPLLKECLLG